MCSSTRSTLRVHTNSCVRCVKIFISENVCTLLVWCMSYGIWREKYDIYCCDIPRSHQQKNLKCFSKAISFHTGCFIKPTVNWFEEDLKLKKKILS